MPALSPTMTHGNVAEWKVTEGQVINAGDVLADIETDKAVMALESMEDGVVAKICKPNGAGDLPVGTVMGVMVEDAADVAAFKDYVPPVVVDGGNGNVAAEASVAPSASSHSSTPNTPLPTGRMWPSVRRLLMESGLDGSKIVGTGPKGVLVKGDVLASMGLCPAPVAKAGAAAVPAPAPAAASPSPVPSSSPQLDVNEFDDIPNTAVRKVIASRLLESKTKSPHEYVSMDVGLHAVNELRKNLKERNLRASVNDCVMYAVSRALKQSPKINSTWDDTSKQSQFMDSVDVAVAIATDGGLITPIVKSADTKSLTKIGEEIRELAGRAREGRLKPSEFTGGSFSVSNLGMFAVDSFSAILNPPQGAIMAVGRGVESVSIDSDGNLIGTPSFSITVSADARVADAADVALFLKTFKNVFENPEGGEGVDEWLL